MKYEEGDEEKVWLKGEYERLSYIFTAFSDQDMDSYSTLNE